jgi:thiamine-monophosphate kinase
VTGFTGLAATAQKYFGNFDTDGTRISAAKEERLLAAWKRPRALVEQGRCLSMSKVVTSCQDSSDGLKAAVQSIAAQSNVGFVVDEDALPVADLVAEIAQLSGVHPTDLILGDSVDFQLVFTVSPGQLPHLRDRFAAHDLSFVEIGTASPSREVVLRRKDGTVEDLPGVAWRHAD